MNTDMEASGSLGATFRREIEKIERSACRSVDIESVPDQFVRQVFASGFDWLADFIMRPHPELGRRGAVCPFVQPAHHDGSLVFCIWDVTGLPFGVFLSILNRLPTLYHRLFADVPSNSRLCSACIFLDGLKEEQYSQYIDEAHSMAKPVFMEAGLMLGEFHPLSMKAGVRSMAFRPMRSNRPAFVVRAITPHDAMFIDRDDSTAEVRHRELLIYKSWVGAVLPEDEIVKIENRIAELSLAIASQS